MTVYLYGFTASLNHRAGDPRACLDAPADVLVDPERDRALVPADPRGWSTGCGLILHARAGRFGLEVLHDGYTSPDRPRPAGWTPPTPPPQPLRQRIPHDVASCLRCRKLVLISRAKGNPSVRLVSPSFWIRSSIEWHCPAVTIPASANEWPKRAGVLHDCYTLFRS